MTMLNRSGSGLSVAAVFSDVERQLLDRLVPHQKQEDATTTSLSDYITKIASLGGYLARTGDSPPGNTVMWRGLVRLTDIELGFNLVTYG